MLRSLASVLTVAQLLLSGITGPQLTLTTWFKTGEMLRFHVVAQDDTAEMQRIKLCVRDAVRTCYQEHHDDSTGTMQEQARALLPLLTEAAVDAARAEGFTGEVDVSLGDFRFDERPLSTTTLPAGTYPALMIRLGDAQGHNWWGLLDPELALRLACLPEHEESNDLIEWDWSLTSLWEALMAFILPHAEGASPC